MEPVKLKKLTVDDLYVTVLTARRATREGGWTRMEDIDRTPPATGSLVMDAVARILAEDSSVTPEGLARLLDADVADVHAVFRLLTGMPMRDFLNAYRQRQACEWLSCTDVPIEQVAARSGFTSHAVLTRFFVKHLKCTPKEYRRATRPADFRQRYAWPA